MVKEKFLLVSLNESKSKQLAQAISNESCRKILDYLADKEASESELASKLNIPISTVHYNLQQLQKGGLVVVEEYHYSEKGKEVNHYKLANKYIIIAPKSTYGIKEKLKGVLPVAILMGIGAGLIQFFSKSFRYASVNKLTTITRSVSEPLNGILQDKAVDITSAPVATERIVESVPTLAEKVVEDVVTITSTTSPRSTALWSR